MRSVVSISQQCNVAKKADNVVLLRVSLETH